MLDVTPGEVWKILFLENSGIFKSLTPVESIILSAVLTVIVGTGVTVTNLKSFVTEFTEMAESVLLTAESKVANPLSADWDEATGMSRDMVRQ